MQARSVRGPSSSAILAAPCFDATNTKSHIQCRSVVKSFGQSTLPTASVPEQCMTSCDHGARVLHLLHRHKKSGEKAAEAAESKTNSTISFE
mmetsp:Transcript_40134/g.72120  ORF Transcript_40134/g.72120 Transcript_40134/m.72120 type:complete len:92 (-) Transcript_40134:31-306(-)